MGDVSAKLMAQFADNLNQMIDEQGILVSGPSDEATGDAATGAAGGAAVGDTTAPAQPQVRKIEGPATEPIDLMEVGGSSVLKRVAPALIALVVILFLLRRRRG
jgi:hypothetical protein